MFAPVQPRVVQAPQLRALRLRVPLAEFVAKRENPLLRPRLLFVAPRPADHRRVAVPLDRLEQRDRLRGVARIRLAAQHHRAARDRILDVADHQLRADLLCAAVAEIDHLVVVVARVDVHERKRQRRPAVRAEPERLEREMQHDHRILAAREQQRRLAAFRDELAQDVDRLGLEPVEMAHPARRRAGGRGKSGLFERRAHDDGPCLGSYRRSRRRRNLTILLCAGPGQAQADSAPSAGTGVIVMCSPHSFVSRDSHHQRPARLSSPGRIARVHGSQPMLG
ncbi:Uncharacterised protein [Burkholderia pseudomallei]|nr:Uncharacterised protein [Burkholderia pseudomallei]CAJ9826297.1 Uncharacterised protein [Burkholderia pseudomallei]